MIKKETAFGRRLDQRLKSIALCWFFNVQLVALRGIPDRVGLINGKFFALELKTSPKAPVTKLQLWVLNKISECGGYAAIVYPENMEEVLGELREWCK